MATVIDRRYRSRRKSTPADRDFSSARCLYRRLPARHLDADDAHVILKLGPLRELADFAEEVFEERIGRGGAPLVDGGLEVALGVEIGARAFDFEEAVSVQDDEVAVGHWLAGAVVFCALEEPERG